MLLLELLHQASARAPRAALAADTRTALHALQVAGSGMPSDKLLDKLLDGEFDPEEYDKQMAAMFDDEYYEVGVVVVVVGGLVCIERSWLRPGLAGLAWRAGLPSSPWLPLKVAGLSPGWGDAAGKTEALAPQLYAAGTPAGPPLTPACLMPVSRSPPASLPPACRLTRRGALGCLMTRPCVRSWARSWPRARRGRRRRAAVVMRRMREVARAMMRASLAWRR